MKSALKGILLLALAVTRPAAPQTSPDIQKVLDRLDRLENENRALLDEIHALRSELEQSHAAPASSEVAAPAVGWRGPTTSTEPPWAPSSAPRGSSR